MNINIKGKQILNVTYDRKPQNTKNWNYKWNQRLSVQPVGHSSSIMKAFFSQIHARSAFAVWNSFISLHPWQRRRPLVPGLAAAKSDSPRSCSDYEGAHLVLLLRLSTVCKNDLWAWSSSSLEQSSSSSSMMPHCTQRRRGSRRPALQTQAVARDWGNSSITKGSKRAGSVSMLVAMVNRGTNVRTMRCREGRVGCIFNDFKDWKFALLSEIFAQLIQTLGPECFSDECRGPVLVFLVLQPLKSEQKQASLDCEDQRAPLYIELRDPLVSSFGHPSTCRTPLSSYTQWWHISVASIPVHRNNLTEAVGMGTGWWCLWRKWQNRKNEHTCVTCKDSES